MIASLTFLNLKSMKRSGGGYFPATNRTRKRSEVGYFGACCMLECKGGDDDYFHSGGEIRGSAV